MSNIFTGKISQINEVKTGESANGQWANVAFEVKRENQQNPDYPEYALFSMFKKGDYINQALDFENLYPLGTSVSVDFNFSKKEYTKNGEDRVFYLHNCWKIDIVKEFEGGGEAPLVEESQITNTEEYDDLPF